LGDKYKERVNIVKQIVPSNLAFQECTEVALESRCQRDPISDFLRGIPLLGDGDGMNFVPTRMKMGVIHSPSGLMEVGMVCCSPSPFPRSP
jgi:hypothetical protein